MTYLLIYYVLFIYYTIHSQAQALGEFTLCTHKRIINNNNIINITNRTVQTTALRLRYARQHSTALAHNANAANPVRSTSQFVQSATEHCVVEYRLVSCLLSVLRVRQQIKQKKNNPLYIDIYIYNTSFLIPLVCVV